MARPNQITKFAIGRYSNGLYTVFGCVYKGVLRGFILYSYWNTVWRRFAYVKENVFQYPNDQFPYFRRKSNIFYRIYLFFKTENYRIQSINDFIGEVADMPKCCWDYRHTLFSGAARNVIFEKYNRKIVVNYYSKLSEAHEYFVVQALAMKYGQFLIKEVLYKRSKPTVRDIFSTDECYVTMQTLHNKGDNLMVWFKIDDFYSTLIETYIQRKRSSSGIQEEFDMLSRKK